MPIRTGIDDFALHRFRGVGLGRAFPARPGDPRARPASRKLTGDPPTSSTRGHRPPQDAGATTPTRALAEDPSARSSTRRVAAAIRRAWPPFKRAWPIVRWFVGLALVAVAVDVLAGHKGELTGIGSVLSHLRWWWIPAAVLAEVASELSFVFMQTRLLRAGGLRPKMAPLAGMTLASQAISNSVPAGPAVAAVYGFRWYRRLGADDTLAGWALVGTTIFAALSLALLAAVGLVLATGQGASLDLIPAVLGILLATLALGVLFVYERPLAVAARYGLALSHRLIGRPRGDHEAHIVALLERISVVRLHSAQAFDALMWAFFNWLFDCSCFALAFLAIGSSVPWKGLLLAYGAGQLAANLPITPGGLGAVEGSITIALSYFGGGTTADVAAVLVYRLISFWLVLVVGWSSWGGLALGIRRGRWPRRALTAPVEPHVIEAEAGAAAEAAAAGAAAAAAADPVPSRVAADLRAAPDAGRDDGDEEERLAP